MSEKPAINADLIERYMKEGNLPCLISIFDFQRRQMTRAEDLSRAYLHQMTVLEARLKEARGEEPRKVAREPDRVPRPVPDIKIKAKSPKSKTAAIAFDLGDLG
jgi:hypothetical protein